MDPVAEIKSRITIEDIVSQYVQLKRVGRNFKGLCPFHKERTPSFYVSPERQMAYCFGCRKGGDIFSFVQEIEGLDFRGALELLADKIGVTLPRAAPFSKEKKHERDRLIELHDKAVEYFENQLWNTDDGKKVLSYITNRGLKESTIKSARIGFSPDSKSDLYAYLLGQNFSRADILASGLAIARDMDEQDCVDRFRRRLMFPIENLAGGVCAFGGRALRDGDEPKYLNSPETSVYQKNSILYGLARARGEIRSKNFAIVVEGYMDALACVQAGFTNVVASSGTALTEKQLSTLKRFTKDIIFSFDRDNAGRMATDRAIELALDQEFSIKVAVWKNDAKDPDECLKTSPKDYEDAIVTAPNAMDYLIDSFKERFGIDKIEGKKKFISSLLPYFIKIKSPIELDLWLKRAADMLGSSLSSIYDEYKRYMGKQQSLPKPALGALSGSSPVDKQKFSVGEYLLGMLWTYPETRGKVIQLIVPEDFEDIELQNIYRSLTTDYNQALGNHVLTPSEQERANILGLYVESRLGEMSWEELEHELTDTIHSLKKRQFDRDKRSMLNQLKEASGKAKDEILDAYQKLLERESL